MKAKAKPIFSVDLCDFGCGNIAAFEQNNGKKTCCEHTTQCPVIRNKNSHKNKSLYDSGERKPTNYASLSSETKRKMAWSAGLRLETDDRLARPSLVGKQFGSSLTGFHEQETKTKIADARIKIILEGNSDTSGRRGRRGHYDGVYFHSSWELALYVWTKEIHGYALIRNMTIKIPYIFENREYFYIPDFIDPTTGEIIEVKGHLYSDRDLAKYDATKNKVRYLFKKDLTPCLQHCIDKYGKQFWICLYG